LNDPAPQHKRPLWLAGSLISLALPPAFFCFVTAFAVMSGSAIFGEEMARALGATILFGFPLAFGATFLLILPAVLLLRKMRRLTALNVCAVGGLAGAVTVTTIQLVSATSFEWVPMALGLGLGVGAAAAFALIAGIPFRRPTP
jgi:hypothetical protein